MLSIDNIILNLLLDEQTNNEETLLADFNIQYPNKRVAEESNSIFVACVSSENNQTGYEFSQFRDLVEILIVTKQADYEEAITLIKNISREICRVIMNNVDKFPNKPVIRSINPEFNRDYVLTRGHIMVQCITEPVDFTVSEEDKKVCRVILDKMEME